MDKNGFFGEMLEKGQQAVTNSAKTVASDVAGQIGFGKNESSPDNQGGAQNQGQTNPQNQQPGEASKPQAASKKKSRRHAGETRNGK